MVDWRGLFRKPSTYIIFISVILLLALLPWFIPASEDPALLTSITGMVTVDTGKGHLPAIENMELSEDDKIKTGAESEATIVLYGKAIMRLEENTEITITDLAREHQQITQTKGRVWSKVIRLAGVESYEIRTPSTTATVRGTALGTQEENDDYKLLIGEGVVGTNQSEDIPQGEVLENINDTFKRRSMTEEERAYVREQLEKDLQELRAQRMRAIQKHPRVLSMAEEKYNVTLPQIEQFLLDIDEGKRTVTNETLASIALPPRLSETLERIQEYNAQIKEHMETLQEY